MKKKTGIFILVNAALMFFVGCSSQPTSVFQSPVKSSEALADASAQAEPEQRQLIFEAEEALQSQRFSRSDELFAQFIRRYPISVFSAQAHFGRARSLEALGKSSEAISFYRGLAEQAREVAPEYAALSYLRLSYCYEALGDESRLMAALADAENFARAKKGSLSEDVVTIEIPARQAASLMRRGQNSEARVLLRKVEKALPDVSPESSPELRDRHSQILLAMGTMQLQGLNAENYLPQLETYQALQVFLWQAVLLKSAPASELALERLSQGYTQFANLAFDPPTIQNGQSSSTSARFRSDLQRRWVARLVESIQALKIYSEAKLGDGGPAFASLIEQIEESARQILWGPNTLNSLTEESKVIKKPAISAPVSEDDPNLIKKESL